SLAPPAERDVQPLAHPRQRHVPQAQFGLERSIILERVVVRNEPLFGAGEKDGSPLPSLALMDTAQSRGFVLRSRVHLLAHGHRIEPFGQAKVGPPCARPQAGYDLPLATA